jgi:hypothetical protein
MSTNKPVGIGFIGAGEISILHAKAAHAIPEPRGRSGCCARGLVQIRT